MMPYHQNFQQKMFRRLIFWRLGLNEALLNVMGRQKQSKTANTEHNSTAETDGQTEKMNEGSQLNKTEESKCINLPYYTENTKWPKILILHHKVL